MLMPIAVLIGDLIASRAASANAVDASMQALEQAARALGDVEEFNPRFTRFRGDGWQVAMPLPGKLLELLLSMIAGLKAAQTGLDTRIAIGIGELERWGTADLSDAAGEAFENSGGALEELNGSSTKRLQLDVNNVDLWLIAALDMVDWIAQGWTSGQAQAVLRALTHPEATNAEQAKALGISRQSYERRLRGSGLSAMGEARAKFAQEDWKTQC